MLHCRKKSCYERDRYTTIHQQFEALVESYLVTLGEDYAYFCENFAEFLQDPGEMTKSRLLFIFELIKDNNARHLTIVTLRIQ